MGRYVTKSLGRFVSYVVKTMSSTPRVALVYDRVNSWGGAERVLEQLHALFPDAPLFTSVYDPKRASWAHHWDVRTSFLQSIPFLRSRHRLLGWIMPLVFELHDLSSYDVVISVTSEFAKSVVTKPGQLHICYVLTPTRYLWSHKSKYKKEIPGFFAEIGQKVLTLLQRYDHVAASRPDEFIAISQLVADRVEAFYGRKCTAVIAPPLSAWEAPQKPKMKTPKKYALTWGRLVGYKRFDLVIRAAVAQNIPLLVAGDGPARQKLEKLAHDLDPSSKLVTFAGALNEAELHWCVQHAQVAVFPQLEDFGISILEACLAGCPVIAHRRSGAAELLQEGNGVFLVEDEDQAELEEKLDQAWSFSGNRLDIQPQARQYAGVRFVKEWQSYLKKRHEEISWRFPPTTRKEL